MKNQDQHTRTGLEIAVIGMAVRAPGTRNIDEFWDNLKNGVELISFFPDQQLQDNGIDPVLLENPLYVKAAGILENIDHFDAFFFGYTPGEAEIMNPQTRVFHECVWHTLEDSGYDPYVYDGLIGLYAGAISSSFWEGLVLFSGAGESISSFSKSQLMDKDFLCTLISYKLNLKGPSLVLQTACSTSLAAVHAACRELLSGECDMALAGGVSISFRPKLGYMYREGMIMSPDGHCRAFDWKTKGTVEGEGAGAVLLKPLENAETDGDHIYAVIKGSSINNDGARKVGYTAPSVKGQAEVIGSALQMARLRPESISYVETHGTGTVLGDPVELEGLKFAFDTDKREFCAIGSIKTNMGHLNAAAGIVGFFKTVLALKHQLIPPTLHYETPNPELHLENSPFYVVTKLKEWKNVPKPLRAGVSSFGIGGTNAHVVLEQYPEGTGGLTPMSGEETTNHSRGEVSSPSKKFRLILLSAKTQSALDRMTENLGNYFCQHPGINLADAAYTLQVGRRTFRHRRMVVSTTVEEASQAILDPQIGKLNTFTVKKENPPVIFMFTGQGAQYVNMGLGLYQEEPLFHQEMNRCFEILRPIMEYDIKEILYPHPGCRGGTPCPPQDGVGSPGQGRHRGSHLQPDRINQTAITQPLIFAFEYALAKLLMKWGIAPYALVGHSIGEYVAACLAGVFSLEDALKLVVLRGKLMQQMPPGAMLSIPLPEQDIIPLLKEKLDLAAVNSSALCVVSGAQADIEALAGKLRAKGHQCRHLHTSHAFHSWMMEPILEDFKAVLKETRFKSPGIPYISNLSGRWIKVKDALDPGYWTRHLKETVRFSQGLEELLTMEGAIFIEIGPGRTLSTFVLQHAHKKPDQMILDLVRHPQEETADQYYLLKQIGHLWLYGTSIAWPGFHREEKRQRISLPGYSFDPSPWAMDIPRDFLDPKERVRPAAASLSKKTSIADFFYIPQWKQSIVKPAKTPGSTEKVNWLVWMDDTGLGECLVRRLKEKGGDVVTVTPGAGYAQIDPGEYILNPGQYDDYHKLLEELCKRQRVPERVIHLWGVTNTHEEKNPGRLDFQVFEKAQDLGFYSHLYLVQAIKKQHLAGTFQITVVTNHMQSVTGQESLAPEKSTVLGPVMVIPQEFPNMTYQGIDVDFPGTGSSTLNEITRQLLEDLLAQTLDIMIAYRSGRRWVQYFEPLPLEEHIEENLRLRPKGVYLITGGLGNIGLTLAGYLSGKVQARLILVGRSAFPGRDEWEQWLSQHDDNDPLSRKIRKIREIENHGGQLLILQADAADEQQMAGAIREAEERFGQIHGIIHAAGTTRETSARSPVNQITKAQAQHQFRPKVYGLLVLEKLFHGKAIDFCLLTSSLSSVLGGMGFTAYSAANHFMDAFVHRYGQDNPRKWISVNWDGWDFTGKDRQAPGVKAGLYQFSMTPEQGVTVFQRILSWGKQSQVVNSTGDLPTRASQWLKHEALRQEEKNSDKRAVHTTSRPALTTSYTAPRSKLEQILADIWQRFFGYDQVGIHDNFFALGGDSLKGMALINRYKELLGEMVHITAVFSAPTIAQLASYIKEHYPGAAARITGNVLSPGDIPGTKPVDASTLARVRQWLPLLPPRDKCGKHPGKKNPPAVFILSPPRSGSTLLRVILGGHSRLFAPPEMGLLASYTLGKSNRAGQSGNQGAIRTIMQIKNCDPEEGRQIMQDYENQHMTSKQFYLLLQQRLEEKNRILVEKSANYALDPGVLQRIDEDFENPSYIHLTRHPYGMIRSFVEGKYDLYWGPQVLHTLSISRMELAEAIWGICHRNILDFLKQVPQHRQYQIKFEDLVREPEKIVRQLCRFLDLDYYPDMLDVYADRKQRMTDGIYQEGMMIGDPKFHQHTGINPKVADTWQEQYKTDFLGTPTRELAQSLGYGQGKANENLSITPVEKREYYALSSAQKRLYILQQMTPNSTAYNLPQEMTIEDQLDEERVKTAISKLMERQEIFRISFQQVNGQPVQKVNERVEPNIRFYDFTLTGSSEEQITRDLVKPFDLSQAPLFRAALIKIKEDKYRIFLDKHHIIFDGTSRRILTRDFQALYEGKQLPTLKLQYRDYSEWQWKPREKGEVMTGKQEYWLKQFEGDIPVLNLPTDYPREIFQESKAGIEYFQLGWDKITLCKQIARDCEVTLFMLILAVYNVFLARICHQEDVVVGVPSAGRDHMDLEPIIGMFANTLALRNYPQGEKTFTCLLDQLKQTTLGAFENQDYQFEDLVARVVRDRDLSRNPLVDAGFTFIEANETPGTGQNIGILSLLEDNVNMMAKLDLVLYAAAGKNNIFFAFEYSSRLFKKETIQRYVNYFKEIHAAVMDNPGIIIKNIKVSHGLFEQQLMVPGEDNEEFGF